MNNINDKHYWYTSIPAIIIAMIFFWPAGCVMLYLRWSKKYGKYKLVNRILLTCAIFLIFIGLMGIIAYVDSEDNADLILALIFFIIPGGICAYFWRKRTKLIKGYDKYLNYIKARKKVKLDTLCDKLNVDYDTATNVITDMIAKEMIRGYLEEDELIVTSENELVHLGIEPPTPAKRETKVAKCKECGAKNTIVIGEKKECDYCGTLLQ